MSSNIDFFRPRPSAGELLSAARAALEEKGFPNAELESRLVVGEALGLPPLELCLGRDKIPPEDKTELVREFVGRRLRHEPLQHIFGKAHFRNIVLKVGPSVLIPRPETELLAGIVLNFLPKGGRVCDVGAGSGAVALSIASENPAMNVTGVEKYPDALACAVENKRRLGVENASFVRGDLLECFGRGVFDAVAANLPYVSPREYEELDDEVRLYEPETALLGGGEDGLTLIKRIAPQAAACLRPGGLLALEHGAGQSEKVLALLEENGSFRDVRAELDLAGKKRFALALCS